MTLKEIYVNFDKNMKKVAKIAEYYYNNNCDFKAFCDVYSDKGFYKNGEWKTLLHMAIRAIVIQIILTFVLPLIVIALALPHDQWILKLSLTLFIGLGLNFITFVFLKRYSNSICKEFNLMSDENIKEAKNNNDYELLLENEKQELNILNEAEEIASITHAFESNSIDLKILNMYFGNYSTFYDLCVKHNNANIFVYSMKGMLDMITSIRDTIEFDFKNGKNVIDSEDSIINYVNKKFDEVFIKSVFKNIIPSSNVVNHAIIIYYIAPFIEGPMLYDKSTKDAITDIATNLVLYKIISYGLYEIENNLFADDSLRDLLATS
jgi:hypothetical protein